MRAIWQLVWKYFKIRNFENILIYSPAEVILGPVVRRLSEIFILFVKNDFKS